jgi:flagellum-specific peptidoglycan hydrolase FlgJ
MLTPDQIQFAKQMVSEAKNSGHPWPGYAAAEASLESAWDKSGLAVRDKDVFGLKAAEWWTGQVDNIITREVINGVSEMVMAKWPVFSSYADCFAARLKVLQGFLIQQRPHGEQQSPEQGRLVLR